MYGSRPTAVNPTTVIIAGGQGARLGGVEKGLIQLGNSTLVERVLSVAPDGPRLINCNRAEPYEFLGLPVVADLVPHRGAPGGVVTALAMAATDLVVAVACDMPNVTRRAIDELLCAMDDDAEVACYERRGSIEPLLAVYRRSLVSRWLPLLETNPSLWRLIRDSKLRLLQVDDDSLLDSVNTVEDLERLRARVPT